MPLWNRLGLFGRIYLVATLLILMAGSVRSVLVFNETRAVMQEHAARNLAASADNLALELSEAHPPDTVELQRLLDKECSEREEIAHIEWRSAEGIIQCRKPIAAQAAVPAWFARLAALPLQPVERLTPHGALLLESAPDYALPLIWQAVRTQVIVVLGVIAVLYGLLALALKTSLRRLRQLLDTLRRYPSERSLRAPIGGAREVRELARQFNHLADELEQAMRTLELSEERAHTTLMAIGDAVIKTDATGKIILMNPVAEQLTGWRAEEATGKPLEQVFHIINQITRETAVNPVARVLREGRVVGLANHTALIARDGHEYVIEDSAAPVFDRSGHLVGCVLVFHDTTEKHQLLQQMSWQALHDPLTGLPNRTLLHDRMLQAQANADRTGRMAAVALLDLDHFKPVNDEHGHATGDRLLAEMAQRIAAHLRGTDTLARLGGDEFVLLFNDIEKPAEAEAILTRIVQSVAAPCRIGALDLHTSCSIGWTLYPRDHADSDELLRHADLAMYEAKAAGRNRCVAFDVVHDHEMQQAQAHISRLRHALAAGELRLFYQPKVNLRTGQIIGYEALLRWQDAARGLVGPGEFLPLIEHDPLLIEIGVWCLHTALADLRRWGAAGQPDRPVAVNIAPQHFMQPDFTQHIAEVLAAHPDVAPHLLQLEILESSALSDIGHVQKIVEECHVLGISFALDDFGTGYSSLSYLKQLPADTVKIDTTFIRDMLDDRQDLALVEAIIGLSTTFGRTVVAEGVEYPEQGVLLMRLGCDVAQGYGIARPMPADDVPHWAAHWQPDPSWSLWADTRWDMGDLPLLVAQYDHLAWVKKVMKCLDGSVLQLSVGELTNHHQCRFGHWYYGLGQQRYGQLAAFREIEPIHTEVHRVGPEIVRLCELGEREAAAEAGRTLLRLKDAIILRLSRLQQDVARGQ